jgi:hypothetical protein
MLASSGACQKKPADAPAATAAATPASSTSAITESKTGAPAAGGDAQAGGLHWDAAPPFVRRPAKSTMRAAEYGVSGDEHAELAVFYFGPDQGGSVDANVTRWLAQFTQADGSDTNAKAKRQTRDIGGVPVTFVEVTGAYSGGMGMPGAPPPTPQADGMLLGAIAAGPAGPVFFKFTGPRAIVEQSRAGFEKLVGSLHK